MSIFSTFISVAILWFLITLFTRSQNSSQSLTETWIVVIGMAMVSLLLNLALGGLPWVLVLLVKIVALYLLIDKVCGTNQATTIRICAWYFGITFMINLFFAIIAS